MTDPLTTAVHRLTRETRTKVIQDGDGSETKTVAITHAPLLTQLNEAITSAIGSGGGGGTSTGSVLNDGAYDLAAFTVRATIQNWLHAVGIRRIDDMCAGLEAWAEAFIRTDAAAAYYIRTMEGWVSLIEGLLDPPTRQEVIEPCPVCGANEYTDEHGNVLGPNPVIIEFRRDRPGEIRATCRACAELWTGVIGVRKLRWDMEQKESG